MATDEQKFQKWMNQVDYEINEITYYAIGLADCADYWYRDAYNSGESPSEVAIEVLRREGFYG